MATTIERTGNQIRFSTNVGGMLKWQRVDITLPADLTLEEFQTFQEWIEREVKQWCEPFESVASERGAAEGAAGEE